MTKIDNAVRCAVIVVLASVFAACQGATATLVAPEDYGTSAIQFDDVPIPAGLRLATSPASSHSHAVGTFRHGDFEYSGHVPIERVVEYMRNRMAVHAWELVGFETTETATDLTFTRRPYEVVCRVFEESALTKMRVSIRTAVGPDDDAGASVVQGE